jgi:hypothetical protein
LRKCDFLTEKLGIGRIRIRNDLFRIRIRIRILRKVPDPQHWFLTYNTNSTNPYREGDRMKWDVKKRNLIKPYTERKFS